MNLPELFYNGKPALPPQKDDLERLYKLITDNFILTVLEFGCGYSTFVIADALSENKRRWDALENKPEVRNIYKFKFYSVDTNNEWLLELSNKLGNYHKSHFRHSSCLVSVFNQQLCHFYTKLPDIVPDFIYIDGPDPEQVGGHINGMTFRGRTPMSADLLLMEPTLIPGTMVLIDGRTNNARFLINNLKRPWFECPTEEDYTLLRLEEPKLGKINAVGRDICKEFQTKN